MSTPLFGDVDCRNNRLYGGGPPHLATASLPGKDEEDAETQQKR